MRPEAQRIAIAEACGWKLDQDPRAIGFWSPPGSTDEFVAEVPDYLNDLNAMHEAEKVLPVNRQEEYVDWIVKIVKGVGYFESLHATSAQRAEAFLKTIGKWSVQEAKKSSSGIAAAHKKLPESCEAWMDEYNREIAGRPEE